LAEKIIFSSPLDWDDVAPMPGRIVIGVGIASHPVAAAGNTWAFLQWALGFRELGWEVWLVEEIAGDRCIDRQWKSAPPEASANLAHWNQVMAEFGFAERASLRIDGRCGNEKALREFAKSADLFLNISGHFKSREILDLPGKRIYLDLDPAFTQIWAEVYGSPMNLEGHDLFFSVGNHMGGKDCRAPDLGRTWLATLPPVSLEYWTAPEPAAAPERWTTVTHWHGYPPVEYKGEWYGNKSEEFEQIIGLPRRTRAQLEIATDLTPENGEHGKLTEQGWHLVLAGPLNTPWQRYRDYLAGSRGEFCVAKNGYVRSRCGWFSDRSACYLALGRPVVLQETGWSDFVPAGEGLLAFSGEDEAAAALEAVEGDWARHAARARGIAEEFLSAPVVAGRLAQQSGLAK
jgi:hypothetical protein